MNAETELLATELDYWLRVIGDRLGADRRFSDMARDLQEVLRHAQGTLQSLPEIPDNDADFTPDLARKIIAKYQQMLSATTISCSGKDITIACVDHDTKQAVMDALTGDGEPVAMHPEQQRIADELNERQAIMRHEIAAPAPLADEAGMREALDPLEKLVGGFAAALLAKLKLSRANGRGGWDAPDWEDECRAGLLRHIEKGDPRDVAAYCAFMWHHGWITWSSAALARPPELENEKLREALKPFAEAASNFTCTIGPDGIDDGVTVAARLHGRPEREATLSSADFSRAARALRREG